MAGQGSPSPEGLPGPTGAAASLGRCFSFQCLLGSGFLWHRMQNSVLGLLGESLVLDSCVVRVFVSVSFVGFCLFGAKQLLKIWEEFYSPLNLCPQGHEVTPKHLGQWSWGVGTGERSRAAVPGTAALLVCARL